MSGHTPGPWKIDGSMGRNQWDIVVGIYADNALIGEKLVGQTFSPNAEDNASLFVAAPDLLEAAKDLIDELDPERGEEYHQEINAMLAAIAKAEGAP